MAIFDTSFGIDFKQNYLILTLLRKSFWKIRLVDYEIFSILPEGQKEERETQLLGLINSFLSKHQFDKERISISLPREKMVVRFIKLPIATKENLRKVVEYEAPKYIPFDKEEIYFDYLVLKEEKEWLYLFTVFAKKSEVDYYLSLLKKIGIKPISIQIPTIAALNLFFFNEGPKEGEISVLFDVTEPFFEMNLVQGREWKESFHLPLPQEGRESKMMNTFKRSGFNMDSLSKSTFFVHGLGTEEKILTALKVASKVKEVLSPPMERIQVEKRLERPYQIYSSLGLPLKGLTKTYVDLNLLPFEMRKKRRQLGKPLFIILICLSLLLSLTWVIGVFSRYRNELDALTAEIKKRKPEVDVVEKLQKQNEEFGREIFELEKIRAGEASMIEILKELTQILPSTDWIWNFKYNGKEIEISGFADSASDLIPLLDKSPFFEKVEFLAPVTKEKLIKGSEGKEKERFKIKVRIEGRRAGS
jgi:general secretion pathway protein L